MIALRSFAFLALPLTLALGSAARAPVPFSPGEEATYKVKLGWFDAGTARLAVAAVEGVRGREAYRLEMDMKGGFPGARVNDVFRSWMDTETLASLRFLKDIQEPNYNPPSRRFEIFPSERRWELSESNERGATASDAPLDDLSFIYFVRTLPTLNVGDVYTLNHYFKQDGNPVVIRVVRKERKKVEGKTYNTVVVQPTINTRGLFSQGGKAEIYFTDDAARHVVYLRSEVPLVGSITLHLQKLREGTPLEASRPARAISAGR